MLSVIRSKLNHQNILFLCSYHKSPHNTITELPGEDEVIELQPCKICFRTFRPELLSRHTVICEKNSKKQKKPFDSSKQRREGTTMASYLPPVNKSYEQNESQQKIKTNWRPKHKQSMSAVKSIKDQKDGAKVFTIGVDNQMCPYCSRNFGPRSYDRHVKFCEEKSQRISTAPITSKTAKERLEARIKYRAPSLKSHRTATKEKYSPKTKKLSSDIENIHVKVIQPSKIANMSNPSLLIEEKKNKNFKILQKKPSINGKIFNENSELSKNLDSHTYEDTNSSIDSFKMLSKSEPCLDNYDPYETAEQQMRELELDVVDIGLKNPLIIKSNDNLENLQISPSSAFVKYSPVNLLASPKSNESIIFDQYNSNTNLNRHPLHSLSNLSLCSIVSLESADFNNKSHSAIEKSSDNLNSLFKRNLSNNPKNNIGIENMLYGDISNCKQPAELKFDIAEQELLKSVSEFENLLKLTDDDDIISPSINRISALSIVNGSNSNSSADSAYGSLNRKPDDHKISENNSVLPKLSKFCHECGFKYPIVVAKYCSECGVRRIVL
ncbi:uncharacterized protein LOC126910297 isoform X2 [Daktulosphaira vitifoliae]|uniref:uncharacterized protein LOC126910297 isoform X2 n=1 Tax=Daktulosphaira vitifoliae TaxID=58002 RepID=UPI0021A9BBCC|nr:uncharacterized protein LOC126910297 isoform X2 [Daktulosphaira vitifoliae]